MNIKTKTLTSSALKALWLLVAIAIYWRTGNPAIVHFVMGGLYFREVGQMEFRQRDKQGIKVAVLTWQEFAPWKWTRHNQFNLYAPLIVYIAFCLLA